MVLKSINSTFNPLKSLGTNFSISSVGFRNECKVVSIVYSGGPYETIVKSEPSCKISADDKGN